MKKSTTVLKVLSLVAGLAIAGIIFYVQMRELGFFEKEEVPVEKSKTATIMVYMLGSDLESDGGCATADIEEMCEATLGENVNVVIQTGGADKWEHSKVAKDHVQRFTIQDGELKLEQNLGLVSMVEAETVSEFLSWSVRKFPADRYGVIFWNHGGGTVLGFGDDEYFPEDELALDEFAEAFEKAGVHVDFVGFDACLMGTVEMAYLLEPYADYLIASEETEPGSGWYYTDWLSMLGENTIVSTESLGKKMVDDYVNSEDSAFWEDKTLALIDLKKIPAVYEQLNTYLATSQTVLTEDGYKKIALARYDTKDFGAGGFEQIDIKDYVEVSGVEGGEGLLTALEEAVVYCEGTISDCCGLAMYYPYACPEYYEDEMQEMLKDIGYLKDENDDFFEEFLRLMEQGRETETIPEEKFVFEPKDDKQTLSLSTEQWENITYIERQVYMDDGSRIIDLGYDTQYEFDSAGDLVADFDSTWVAINGEIVSYYIEDEGEREDGSWYTLGYMPAELTRGEGEEPEYIEIVLYRDAEHPEGYVTGYRGAYEENGMNLPARNLLQFEEGDKINFIYYYYTYAGTFDVGYDTGDTIIYGSEGFSVTREEIIDCSLLMNYYMQDIYQNEYWTEYVEFDKKSLLHKNDFSF